MHQGIPSHTADNTHGYTPRAKGLLRKIHVKFHVSYQGCSNLASDWLVSLLPANQMLGLEIFGN